MGIFNSVPVRKVKRSKFNKSITYENKLSFDFGMIVPILAKDLLPGDNFYFSPEVFMRTSPLVAPLMQLCDVHIDIWKVPFRLVMRDTPQIPGFETFMSPKDIFGEGEQPTMSQIELTFGDNIKDGDDYLSPGSLSDYLGIPTIDANFGEVTYDGQKMVFRAIDHIAYQWIYDEYYRNENVQDPILDEDQDFLSKVITEFDDLERLMTLRYRNWPKDYFTSALPNTQRGIDVGIPITADVNISYTEPSADDVFSGNITKIRNLNVPGSLVPGPLEMQVSQNGLGYPYAEGSEDVYGLVDIDNSDRLKGTMSNVLATEHHEDEHQK